MPPFPALKNWLSARRRLVPEPLRPHLRSAWALIAPVFWRRRQVLHSYAGNPFKVWITDPTAAEWYDQDWDLPAEIAFLQAVAERRGQGGLRPGATVFDLGAHQALVAMILALRVTPGGKVIALEAGRRNAGLARRNVEANGLSALVTVVWSAAGPSDGEIVFEHGFNGRVSSGRSLSSAAVPLRAVDSLAAEHGKPDLVFIDVEGFEREVLKGASKTLAANRTDFFVEVHAAEDLANFGASAETVLSAFPPSRFDLHLLDPLSEDETSFRPLSACAGLAASGKRFYLLATWK